jgi:hypothetical protein
MVTCVRCGFDFWTEIIGEVKACSNEKLSPALLWKSKFDAILHLDSQSRGPPFAPSAGKNLHTGGIPDKGVGAGRPSTVRHDLLRPAGVLC